jgi:hypothetical protein
MDSVLVGRHQQTYTRVRDNPALSHTLRLLCRSGNVVDFSIKVLPTIVLGWKTDDAFTAAILRSSFTRRDFPPCSLELRMNVHGE